MEMESHILGTPNLRRRKNTIFFVYNLFFVNVDVVTTLKINYVTQGKGTERVRQG